MEGLIVLLVLAVLAVPVLLVVALVKIGGLRGRLDSVERDVAALRGAAGQAPIAAPAAAYAPAPGPASAGDASVVAPAGAGIVPGADPDDAQGPTLADLMRESAAAAPPRAPARSTATPSRSGPGSDPGSTADAPSSSDRPPAGVSPVEPPAGSGTPPPLPPRVPRAAPPPPPPPRRPDPVSLGLRALRRWFSEGNVPVKVGMLVLFAGVAALLKYAGDQGWMRFPIELRLAGVALAAVAALGFGWRQREHRRSFALALQGGAIGVLLLVVFAAFKLYPLLPAGAAFGLSVVLVAGAGVLAVRQDAVALAWLGILAGFLAPIWLSTGQGNHVALFGYYAVLNAAIFGIAWYRSWRALNVLGFVFTFAIGTLWGVLRYRPEDYATTQPFLLLFFAFYLLLPILHARRRAGRRDGLDSCLLFGAPLVAFSLQAGLMRDMLVDGERLPLALCALGVAAVYAGLAMALRRREVYAPLVAPYAVLAAGFATLAVPLALSANATAGIFALEGAAAAWLGLRQGSRLQQLAGAGLQLAAAAGFVIGLDAMGDGGRALANPAFMAALLIAVAGFASAWSYRRADNNGIALAYYGWGLAWWLGNLLAEIQAFAPLAVAPDLVLMLALATGWIAVEVHRRSLPSTALQWTGALALAAALPLALVQDAEHGTPLAQLGWASWALFALAGWRVLPGMRRDAGQPRPPGRAGDVAHAAWLLAWPLLASLSLQELGARSELGDGWIYALAVLPWAAMAATLQWRAHWVPTPARVEFEDRRGWLAALLVAIAAGAWLVGLLAAGESRPLPWIALLNPHDVAQLALLAVVAGWVYAQPGWARQRAPLLAGAAFVLVSVVTLRACHHWGGVAWTEAMFHTSLVQTSLTVVWSLLGVLGWIVGSRRGQRGLWLGGAVLMAVVLAKLLLVDRQHLGNLLGIVSFIAYGLLCTVVGYLAPAPPRSEVPSSDGDDRSTDYIGEAR